MESVRVRYVDGTGMESPLCLQPIRSGAEELLVNIPVRPVRSMVFIESDSALRTNSMTSTEARDSMRASCQIHQNRSLTAN